MDDTKNEFNKSMSEGSSFLKEIVEKKYHTEADS